METLKRYTSGALAEVHFSIRHWNIQRRGQVPQTILFMQYQPDLRVEESATSTA